MAAHGDTDHTRVLSQSFRCKRRRTLRASATRLCSARSTDPYLSSSSLTRDSQRAASSRTMRSSSALESRSACRRSMRIS